MSFLYLYALPPLLCVSTSSSLPLHFVKYITSLEINHHRKVLSYSQYHPNDDTHKCQRETHDKQDGHSRHGEVVVHNHVL